MPGFKRGNETSHIISTIPSVWAFEMPNNFGFDPISTNHYNTAGVM